MTLSLDSASAGASAVASGLVAQATAVVGGWIAQAQALLAANGWVIGVVVAFVIGRFVGGLFGLVVMLGAVVFVLGKFHLLTGIPILSSLGLG